MNQNQQLVTALGVAALIIFLLIKLKPGSAETSLDHALEAATDTSRLVLECDAKNCELDSTFAYPPIFEAAFRATTSATQYGSYYDFSVDPVGELKVESGKIIACDPIVMPDRAAFEQVFPIGKFPVEVSCATSNAGEFVAFSRIRFSDQPVANWEFALLPGQEQIPLNDSAFYCFSVDAGQAIFIDEKANFAFNKRGQDEWNAAFLSPEDSRYIYRFGPHNLAAFSTGWGDGCYATYVGYDSTGAPCRLLTDFGIFEWWKKD